MAPHCGTVMPAAFAVPPPARAQRLQHLPAQTAGGDGRNHRRPQMMLGALPVPSAVSVTALAPSHAPQLVAARKGTPQGPATPKPTRSPRWLQDLRDSRSTNGRAAPARPDPCWIQQPLWPHLNGHQRLSHPGTQEPTRRSARKMLSTRCHPWLGQVCPGSPGTACPPALPRIEASPRQGAEPTLRGRQSCPGLAAAAATRGPKSQSRKSNGAADTSTTRRCPERPRCRRQRALQKGDFTGCWIMLQPSRAGPTRTKGRPDPQRPPAPSQHHPGEPGLQPRCWARPDHHRPPPARPLQLSKRLVLAFSPTRPSFPCELQLGNPVGYF